MVKLRSTIPGLRSLRYSINVTLDGCCDHRAIPADEDYIVTPWKTSTGPMLSSWPGDLRNDGGSVSAAGADRSEA